MQLQPYLFFNGRCEEAAEFYCESLGATVTSKMRFSEMPDVGEMPSEECAQAMSGMKDKIMHMSIQVGEATVLMSDGMSQEEVKYEGFSLALSLANDDDVRRCFERLADGGKVDMALEPTFWASLFGIVTDRFGVSWMVMAAA